MMHLIVPQPHYYGIQHHVLLLRVHLLWYSLLSFLLPAALPAWLEVDAVPITIAWSNHWCRCDA
jgi:hypothetical protein